MNLSKSKYVSFCQCSKLLWLNNYKPEEKAVDEELIKRFALGNIVGDMAKDYFGKGNYADLDDLRDENGKPLYGKMLDATQAEIQKGTENICEAAFSYDGCYCAVDILHKVPCGYEIYEVKSTGEVKDVYCLDAAYQKWVLEKCGIKVVGVYIMIINKEFVKYGEIDVKEFFKPVLVDEQVDAYYADIAMKIAEAKATLENKDVEPAIDIGYQCHSPYDCQFMEYCFRQHGIPEISVFDIMGINYNDACDLYHRGIVNPDDIEASGRKLNDKNRRQIEFLHKGDDEVYIDKAGVKEFLDGLTYPLYFLDFETFKTVVPIYDGTWPNQQVPFQYSLHVLDKKGAKERHYEFLAKEGVDPRREIAESLVQNIPADVCVMAYWKTFECGRLKELAQAFPDLADHLLAIASNIVDLLDVFRSGYVYNKAMGDTFSIKSVLPALFPNDTELNYHALEDVHNGNEATATFLELTSLSKEEIERKRANLLKYCHLDTLAMVRILQWLEAKVR